MRLASNGGHVKKLLTHPDTSSRFLCSVIRCCLCRRFFGRPLQVAYGSIAQCYGTDVLSVVYRSLCNVRVLLPQTVVWIKMSLCTEVGLGPGDILFMVALWNRADHIYFHAVVCYGRPMYRNRADHYIFALQCGYYLSIFFYFLA